MAKVDVKMPEEFLLKLSRLGSNTDAVAEKVLEAGGEVVLTKVRSNLSSVVGSGTKYASRSTGELESSLGLSPVKADRDGEPQHQGWLFRTPQRWRQQREAGQYSGIRQTRSAREAISETGEKRLPRRVYPCDEAEAG